MRRMHRKEPLIVRIIQPSWFVRPLGVVLFLVCALSLVWVRTQVRDVRYRLTELEWELKAAQETQQELRMKRAMLSSPARVETAARRVGFTYADRSRIFIIDADPKAVRVSSSVTNTIPRAPRS